MFHYYKVFLLLIQFAIPISIIGFKNKCDNASNTLLRFCIAVLLVWGYIFIMRSVIVEIDLLLATTAKERFLISQGDGAKNAFAFMFGWIPGIISSGISWLLIRGWLWLKPKLGLTQGCITSPSTNDRAIKRRPAC